MIPVVLTGVGLVCPDGDAVADPSWFDPGRYLGPRGWRFHSPATQYLLAAATLALADARLDPASLPERSMGVAVGTNFAASRPVARLDQTLIADGEKALNAVAAPNFSVNIPASHVSSRFGMRGYNVSLTNPTVAGLEAAILVATTVQSGRITAGIAGATEELPDVDGVHTTPSEGACCLVLERGPDALARGAPVRAELVGGFSRFAPPEALARPAAHPDLWASVLGRPLTRLVDRVAEAALPVAVVTEPALGGWLFEYCAGRLGLALVDAPVPGRDGSHFTVSPLLALAGLVSRYGHGLVLTVGGHGHVAAAYLRSALTARAQGLG